ncbi:Type 1 glutamine amidotransferase-like domain-containing protein [Kribbella sp. DT2]|uniref:Type 1 glutamine amidotransferase-like domain-containing protein n=1 Tax=Kribbella sp. DT2 TaxID=3393427 RepID=UPI003CF91D3F
MRQILALGGGGFSMEPDNPLLDDHLLSLARTGAKPRVCFVPTASGDSDLYSARFLDAFGPERAEASVLSLFNRTVTDLDEFVRSQDVIYVGGGSTANLLAIWRVHGLDRALSNAYDDGVVLAGISAGMNCWFEASVTDSYDVNSLAPLDDGLGLLPGSACPHYDGEELRRGTYLDLVRDGFRGGYAAEDGVGLHFRNGELVEAVTSTPGKAAYVVRAADGEVVEERLDARYLGDQ